MEGLLQLALKGFPHRSWASSEYYKIARLLLENGANASDIDDFGNTALDYAKSLPWRYNIIDLLSREW